MNVLLIIIDCLRADRLAAAERLAPHLHSLARRSFVFTHAFTNGPYTKAAMPALLYSAYYSDFLANRSRPDFRSLPEVLREAGWVTMAVQTNAYLSTDFGWGKGFDYYDESILPWLHPTPRQVMERKFAGQRRERSFRGAAERALLYLLYCKGAADCRTVNRKFRALLRRAWQPGRRHFALLHYMDLHEPVVLPRRWRRGLPALHPHRVSELAHTSPRSLGPEEWRFLAGSYDAALGMVDHELGQMLASPELAPFTEEGIVAVTSDHGEELGEHGYFGHTVRFSEELLRVPLLIHLPGTGGGGSIEALVCHLDLAPTLLDACSLPAEGGFAGRSFLGLMDDRAAAFEERPVVAEALIGGKELACAARTRRHKLIEHSRELYDLEADPGDTVNLYEGAPELAEELHRLIERHRQNAGEPGSLAEPTVADHHLRKRLRSLGYVD